MLMILCLVAMWIYNIYEERYIMKLIKNVYSILFVVLFSGCSSPDIAIIDLDSGENWYPPNSAFRQVVIGINEDGSGFKTIVRERKNLFVRSYNLSGEKVGEIITGILNENSGYTDSYILSPDGEKLVYSLNTSIYQRDLITKQTSLLWEDAIENNVKILKIFHISNSKLLVVTRKKYQDVVGANEIILFDIQSKSKKVLYNPTYPSLFEYALSPDKKLFTFYDGMDFGNSVHGFLKVIDLPSGALVAVIGDEDYLYEPQWNPDGSELIYVEGKQLKIWTLSTHEERILYTMGKKDLCYKILFLRDKVAFLRGGHRTTQDELVVLDQKTGKVLKIVKEKFNGDIFTTDSIKKIVCEIGY